MFSYKNSRNSTDAAATAGSSFDGSGHHPHVRVTPSRGRAVQIGDVGRQVVEVGLTAVLVDDPRSVVQDRGITVEEGGLGVGVALLRVRVLGELVQECQRLCPSGESGVAVPSASVSVPPCCWTRARYRVVHRRRTRTSRGRSTGSRPLRWSHTGRSALRVMSA